MPITKLDAEKEHFMEIWKSRSHSNRSHTKEAWNERAKGWDDNLKETSGWSKRSDTRINETVRYLKSKGLLKNDQTLVDIGCGPGRFAVEFARDCAHVTAIDISDAMCGMGSAYAAENNVSNIDFVVCDFKNKQPVEMGWDKSFDIVFSSITPAVNTPDGLEKMEEMSRAYVFSSNFVYAHDRQAQEAASAVLPGLDLSSGWDGKAFYAMFNLLWLRGRLPCCDYYTEKTTSHIPVTHELVERMLHRTDPAVTTAKVRDDIYRWMCNHADKDGFIDYETERRFGWLLWDVRECVPRSL